jgi:hypothetical protein
MNTITVQYLTYSEFENQLEKGKDDNRLYFNGHLVKQYKGEDGYYIKDDEVEHIMLESDILILFPDGQFCTIDAENLTLQYG